MPPKIDEKLRQSFRQLAADLDGIDVECYEQHRRDRLDPIVGHGDRAARVAFFGRDPGRDEVCHHEPFIGAGGQLVRRALHLRLHGRPLPDFEASREVGRHFFWANTVPYKPTGNKAWSMAVKKRFQPLMAKALLGMWSGEHVITLGREAFLWFGINRPKDLQERLDAFWESADRFETSVAVEVEADGVGSRELRLHPLPHPSPLNATWYKRFPELLARRLEQLKV